MARPRTLDYAAIQATYAETGNARETSLRLGVHFNTVYRVLREQRGECARCTTKIGPGENLCASCRKTTAEFEANHRERRKVAGICRQCSEPVVPGKAHCQKHIDEVNANRRKLTRNPIGREKRLAQGRYWNRRSKYGETAAKIWDDTEAKCAICSAPYVHRRSHIHHIDRDHGNGSEENLIVLCASCHHLVHSLGAHRDPRLVLSWYERTYGEIRPLS